MFMQIIEGRVLPAPLVPNVKSEMAVIKNPEIIGVTDQIYYKHSANPVCSNASRPQLERGVEAFFEDKTVISRMFLTYFAVH